MRGRSFFCVLDEFALFKIVYDSKSFTEELGAMRQHGVESRKPLLTIQNIVSRVLLGSVRNLKAPDVSFGAKFFMGQPE